MIKQRLVVDTNVLVSQILLPNSSTARAAYHAAEYGQLIFSDALFNEVIDVLSRPKFDAYVTLEERQRFLLRLASIAEMTEALHRVEVCRDGKDNCVLEAALSGNAELILTGDKDLLMLHPFRNITILAPADYLKAFA